MTVVTITQESTTVAIGADASTVVATGTIGPTGATGPAGPAGPAGASTTVIRRHEWVTDTSYFGTAPIDAAEADEVWRITKCVVAANGTTTVTHAADVAWTDRLTAIYS
jgi:hypothetical protein